MKSFIYSKKYGYKELYFDSEDLDIVNSFNWIPHKDCKNGKFYAHCFSNEKTLSIHRLILNPSKVELVDHINGNTLDNRRCNLRIVTSSQNQMNRDSAKGFKGVSFDKDSKTYRVRITIEGKIIHGGKRYDNIYDAANRYNELAKIHHGEYASLNILP